MGKGRKSIVLAALVVAASWSSGGARTAGAATPAQRYLVRVPGATVKPRSVFPFPGVPGATVYMYTVTYGGGKMGLYTVAVAPSLRAAKQINNAYFLASQHSFVRGAIEKTQMRNIWVVQEHNVDGGVCRVSQGNLFIDPKGHYLSVSETVISPHLCPVSDPVTIDEALITRIYSQ